MKNLVELKKEELKEVEGGFWPIVAAGLLIGAGVQIMGDWDDFTAALAGECY